MKSNMVPISNQHPYILFSCEVEQGVLIFSNTIMYKDSSGLTTIAVGDKLNVYLIPRENYTPDEIRNGYGTETSGYYTTETSEE